MAQKNLKEEYETIVVDNFYGSLTRKLNGSLNSGQAKFTTSFGYDPFSKPGNLIWLEAPTDISGPINDLIVAAKNRFEGASASTFIYALGSSGKLYKIQPNTIINPNADSVVGVFSVLSNGASYNFGGSLEFYGYNYNASVATIYVGADGQVNRINSDGTGDTVVGSKANYTPNRYRPLAQFIGYLIFGNGNNIGAIDSTGTVVSSVVSTHYEQLSPTLPLENNITDLDVSVDGNYLSITTSGVSNENILTVSSDRQAAAASFGNVFNWNGTDRGITSFKTIPSYAVTALQTYLDNNSFFSDDSFGASISNGSQKIVSLPGNKSPFANATTVNGNFLTWVAPEVNVAGTGLNASMYYYGQLDNENPIGLWRVLRYSSTLTTGFIYQTPMNIMTNNKYSTVNNAITAITTLGYGKHYLSVMDVNNSTTKYTLQRFLITPTGNGTAQTGVYETQTQLFQEKVTIKEVRVYTEGTVTNNGFQIDIIGTNGAVMSNGTFNYTFVAGSDPTLVQGSQDLVDYNPAILPTYGIGIRVTNTGTANMTIKKIEVDIAKAGK